MEDLNSTKDEIVPTSYAKVQRVLASHTLQNRELNISGLPSRYYRPSEAFTTSDSCISQSNGSTVNESDLLRQNGVNNTSTPRPSIMHSGNIKKIDVAESMERISVEMRNSDMSLSTALQKMEEEYNKVRNSISLQSVMFKPAEESQLLADEVSWMRERELPAKKIDFTIDTSNTSNMSISTFFKQRSEDISSIIPLQSREILLGSNVARDILPVSMNSSTSSIPLSSSSVTEAFSLSESEQNKFDNIPLKESLSISKIAKILENSEETPNKLLNFLLKQCPTKQCIETPISQFPHSLRENDENLISRVGVKAVDDIENFPPSSEKENINFTNIPQLSSIDKLKLSTISKSQSSVRSTSTLSNLPGGKLPIETTHCELVWGCVKAGKSETKQFTLRNRSSNKLRIQCSITGPSFRIIVEHGGESFNSIKLMFHAHETKKISVIFNPLTKGAASDEILFVPCDPTLQQSKKLSIKLIGYGGIGIVEIKNILKDSTSRCCLSLGNVFGRTTISKNVSVLNKGTLPAFALFDYLSKGFRFSNVSINPNNLILAPNEERNINITIKVTREDIEHIENSALASVFEIGIVKVVSGSEPIRGRIRKVCKLALQKKLELDSLSFRLQQTIEREAIPTDVVKCKDSVNSLKLLLQGLLFEEVVIMLERDMDCTLVPTLIDESSLFQSMYDENTLVENPVQNSFRLEPSSLILAPPSKSLDNILLISESESSFWFEVIVPDGITVNPQTGSLLPHSTKLIELKIKNLSDIRSNVFSVSVCIENIILCTDVKILFV